MKILNKQELIEIIQNDIFMMEVLRTAAQLNLPDWWISAGFVRNKVWDLLHDKEKTPLNDVDVIYFDKEDMTIETEIKYEDQLKQIDPNVPWSVKNQARMHLKNNVPPYCSSIDAVNHYTEIPTAICATLRDGKVVLHYVYSFEELVNGIVRPTPYFDKASANHHIYLKRIHQKNWSAIWPKLVIER